MLGERVSTRIAFQVEPRAFVSFGGVKFSGTSTMHTAKASSDIRVIAETDPEQWTSDNPDLHVRVKGLRKDDTVVIEGVIKLWVTDKPSTK